MTAAAPAKARPARPPRSLFVPLALGVFLLISWWSLSAEFGIGFDLGSLVENITRGAKILWRDSPDAADRGLLNPNWAFLPRTGEPMLETFQIAVIGALVGCGLALPISFLASRVTAPGRFTLIGVRGVLSVVRAVPDILYALIFVAATQIGPLPGILALIFFNIGVVAKLMSETIDGVDPGPIESAQASGGNRAQTVRWAVLPQVLPHYVAYALYTFELNIRASTVLGIVGAGGIGRILYREYGFFHWSNVSVIIVELFVLVFFIELVSISLRRRLV